MLFLLHYFNKDIYNLITLNFCTSISLNIYMYIPSCFAKGMDSYPDIYSLPPPIKEEFGGHGEIINLRIPPPLHQPQEKLDVHQVCSFK